MKRTLRHGASTLAVSLFLGCSGPPVNVSPVPPTSYSEVGHTSGQACGMLFLWIVPMGVNDRVERAYARALARADATSLTDTALEESWYFALVGDVVCSEVEGLALKRTEGASSPSPARGELRKK
jgi:hypothetical protein